MCWCSRCRCALFGQYSDQRYGCIRLHFDSASPTAVADDAVFDLVSGATRSLRGLLWTWQHLWILAVASTPRPTTQGD
jgi:hypothetical protein